MRVGRPQLGNNSLLNSGQCDQNRPTCSNCLSAEIRCSFLSKDEALIIPHNDHESAQEYASNITPGFRSTPRSPSRNELSRSQSPWASDDSNTSYEVNFLHLELFINLSGKSFLAASNNDLPDRLPMNLYMQHAWQTPYLMHQVLATSALHLSTTKGQSTRHTYRQQATGLQTRALSLFNQSGTITGRTQKQVIELFLFASLLSVHLLCDPLLHPGSDLRAFLARFTDALVVCRGVLPVVGENRHLLKNTELGPPLEAARSVFDDYEPRGSECDVLEDLIAEPKMHEVYHGAVITLRRVFVAQSNANQYTSGSYQQTQAVFAWPFHLSTDFTSRLSTLEPQALITMAHYAILLHRCRRMWHFGNGGRFLIEHIGQELGAEWDEWLRLPRAALTESEPVG